MPETKLKPCPFCGGEAMIIKRKSNAAGSKFVYRVQCCADEEDGCSCIPKTWNYYTKEEAIEAWNRRAENEP